MTFELCMCLGIAGVALIAVIAQAERDLERLGR